MTNTKCLNCDHELNGKYCSNCGQKADTRRITFQNFIYQDLLHGTFHIEKGMIFTAKESLLNPGRAALDYISGKRKRYYNVFLLILITFGVMMFIRHVDLFGYFNPKIPKETVYINEASEKLDKIITQKIFIFLFVPLSAINSFILFKRKQLNLSEHFIISGMIILGILIIGTFFNFFSQLNLIFQFDEKYINWFTTLIIFLYAGYGYYYTFSSDYTRFEMITRLITFFVFLLIEVTLLIFIIFGFITNWKFGQLILSPFG